MRETLGDTLLQETILVVDDDQGLMDLLRDFFVTEGYQVAVATTGDEALVSYQQVHPDLILMDIHMPSMDGLAACQALRDLVDGEQIPIVLMTGFNDLHWMARAFEVGATDYITKPFELPLLLQRVRRSLRIWQAERELRESQRLLSTLMSHLPGMAYRGKPTMQRTMTFLSQGAVNLTGYLPAELVGPGAQPYGDLVHAEDRAAMWQSIQEAMASRQPFQATYRLRTAEGSEKCGWEQGQGVFAATGECLALEGFVVDITERKQHEEALQQSVEEYRQLFEAAHDAILIILPINGRIIAANSRASAMYGVPQTRLLEMTLQDVSYPQGPGTRLDDAPGLHLEIIRRPGQDDELLVEVSQVPISYEGQPAILRISRDITERQQALQRVAQAERLAAVGRLAATLAHEINNPLQAIQSHLDLILDFPITPEEKESSLLLIRREIERLGQGSRRILNLARPATDPPQAVWLDIIVGQALRLLRQQIEEAQAQVNVALRPVSPVLADPDALTQVCLNLILNTLEALPPHGQLDLDLSSEDSYVYLRCTTHGQSIPLHHLPHLFKPFFSTKGKGTGLGLYISHELITQYGGTLTAQNLPEGSGVTFTVCLPALEALQDPNND
ncbi:MAG: response regulator [Ardenticatenales bacterium]|nr:response regulator [Ardenticatenales bacterium]